MGKAKDDFLNERSRAEDIILGGLGFGEEVTIIEIQKTSQGFQGVARDKESDEYPFESEDEVTDLEQWALSVLLKTSSAPKANRK